VPADVYGTPDDKHLLVGLTGGDGVEVYDISGPKPKLFKKMSSLPKFTLMGGLPNGM
jgi:hypothetical protein